MTNRIKNDHFTFSKRTTRNEPNVYGEKEKQIHHEVWMESRKIANVYGGGTRWTRFFFVYLKYCMESGHFELLTNIFDHPPSTYPIFSKFDLLAFMMVSNFFPAEIMPI